MPLPDYAEPLLTILAPKYGAGVKRKYIEELRAPPCVADVLPMIDAKNKDYLKELKDEKGDLKRRVDRAMEWLSHPNHHFIPWYSPLFPAMLKRGDSFQAGLFVDGNPLALWFQQIAVIGSRNPSWQGKDNTDFFVEGLVKSGLAITSGLAAGIDSRAHEAALRFGGVPIGVLGNGPDVIYPASNRRLQTEVAEAGAVVTEFFPGDRPDRYHFPLRNRIIAGLSVATMLIEGREGSGATGTAKHALDNGKEVFAVPGSIHNPLYRGNHRLIKDGAILAQSIPEVLQEIEVMRERCNLDFEEVPEELKAALAEQFWIDPIENPFDDPDYNTLWQSFDDDPTDMGSLVERTGLTFAKVSVILVELESEGKVISLDGRYHKVRKRRALSGAG